MYVSTIDDGDGKYDDDDGDDDDADDLLMIVAFLSQRTKAYGCWV